jgi:hypothetical protein
MGPAISAGAQALPSEPIVVGGGRLTIGGDISASFGCALDTTEGACGSDVGFFNYSDYEHSVFRMLRIAVTASLNAGEHVAVLGELRTENLEAPEVYAFYVRVRPWTNRSIDIAAGRVPPVFGAFARRIYAADNPLIGYPLAYQYLTSLRSDALPASADELLRMRGRGWLASYSIGNTTPDRGLPVVSSFRWDTGVVVHGGFDRFDASVAVTTGTISDPLFRDDNSGRQIAGRIGMRGSPGLLIGVSASHGPFLSARAARGAVGDGHDRDFTQTAFGVDAEYSRDYYVLRGEAILSRWTLPSVQLPLIDEPISASTAYVEGRYKIRPGLYAAARLDYLGFSDITGTDGRDTWDAPVTRVEVGGGYSLQRNLVLKGTFQHNVRGGGRVTGLNVVATQLVYWF